MRNAHPRKPADFLRNDPVTATPQKRCLSCHQWKDLTKANYQTRRNRSGSMAWQARCKVCESPKKKAMYERHQAALRGAEAVPVGPTPPKLTWRAVLGWLK